jgi:hypothetical protein
MPQTVETCLGVQFLKASFVGRGIEVGQIDVG